MSKFLDAYIEAALWSTSYGEEGESNLDDGEHELADETRETMRKDCEEFIAAAKAKGLDLEGDTEYRTPSRSQYVGEQVESAGHDFWLTRCGHGAGFWDGDWIEPAATILTDLSNRAGNIDLYVSDDGRIYQ